MGELICQFRSPLLQETFSGKIIKNYNKSCLVEIVNYEAIDEYMVKELLGKIVVSNKKKI